MDDAALVLAARAGDREALAAIYDRYADRLHDYCWSILRDRDEAADAFHDAFLAAAQRLDQLRDPSKLRPWLYAIARHEALRRATSRRPVEELDDMTADGGPEVDEPARQEDAVRIVWAAAAGLAPRDRALLDLNLRQGLEGQDLADAMGVEVGHSYVLLSRLRDQVERSLGALLVARYGRRDCPDLARILEGWDGRFSPLIRKRVARHADECPTCGERRRTLASPAALLGVVPLVPAPAQLKDRILGDVQLVAAHSWPADSEGFPPTAFPRSRSRRVVVAAGAALLVAAALLLALLGPLQADRSEEIPLVAAGPSTTIAAPSTTVTELPAPASSPTTPPTTVVGPATTTTTTTGPRLSLSTSAIAFGATSTAQPLEIANDGDAFLTWTAGAGAGPFSATPAGGSVAPGDSVRVTVRLNRAAAPGGRLDGVLQVSSNGGTQAVRLTASVNDAPVIDPVTIDNPRLGRSPCSTAPTAASVRATVIGASGVDTVVLRWRDPAGTSGRAAMVAGPDSTYSGRLGPFTAAGTVTWWVEATDGAGASARSPDRTATVAACG
jgi:RNA polymerase sigma factor (sigma-70 family)